MIDLDRISPPNRRSNHLLVVRLDNARAIAAAYGEEALVAAMAHLRAGIAGHFDPVDFREATGDAITLLAHAAMLEPDFVCAKIEALCIDLCGRPMAHGDCQILLSVSIGHSDPVPGGLGEDLAKATESARERLHRVAAPAARDGFTDASGTDVSGRARYRDDMARAARLLGQVERGETFFAWRPVFDPRQPERILQHEALLRYADEQGEQFDCVAACQALERLGLVHLLDRALVLRVLDELEADPRARLSIAISPQSLSFDLGGYDAAWTDFLARLERRPELAERLVLEFHESAACRFWPGTLTFLNTLRELGVGLGLFGFGSGHASLRQLAVLRPDQVKLDSAFLRTAFLSERNRARIGQLAEQAHTLCGTVILIGVETPAQIRLAVEEGAPWVAGARLGRVSRRRAWSIADPVSDPACNREFAAPVAVSAALRAARSPVF
ncbi:MAG: hypothetical protein DI555_19975 [Novosphingobium pentaromativorans]|uniref:EAL domain-containing protein n=1 Tax=Novosphingobium pentaromativorans TaxID=205844 RepID=A0A2W5NMH7_9SPHN|nr:MAG: hypothetical protein DI555_19975 [Novosphingobium pentaromativorans]